MLKLPRLLFILSLIASIILVAVIVHVQTQPVAAPAYTGRQPATATPKTPPSFNIHAYSTTDPASIWVIVNKQHPLVPKDYAPAQLVVPSIPLRSNITATEQHVSAVMAPALEEMVAAAKAGGITLNLQSGYRSYSFQVNLYTLYIAQQGQAAADRSSARPGYSEHQTGLAADLGGITNPACNVEECFKDTPEGQWLAAHAYEYGFIIRYTTDKESVTGYEDEPWHVRYIGKDLSQELHKAGVTTLEEFFGVSGGTAY